MRTDRGLFFILPRCHPALPPLVCLTHAIHYRTAENRLRRRRVVAAGPRVIGHARARVVAEAQPLPDRAVFLVKPAALRRVGGIVPADHVQL